MSALKLVYKINREQRNEWKFRISHPFLFLEWERNMQEQMVRLKIFFRLYGIEHEDRKVINEARLRFDMRGRNNLRIGEEKMVIQKDNIEDDDLDKEGHLQ